MIFLLLVPMIACFIGWRNFFLMLSRDKASS